MRRGVAAAIAGQPGAYADDDEACAQFGIDYATRQCEELLRAGVPGLHFYTLNKARSTSQVVKNLGLGN